MIKPINDGILIREIKPDLKSPGGIDLIKAKPVRRRSGEVLAVGKGHRLQDGTRAALDVEVGEIVLFNYANGNDIDVDGEELNMCREQDIVGIVE